MYSECLYGNLHSAKAYELIIDNHFKLIILNAVTNGCKCNYLIDTVWGTKLIKEEGGHDLSAAKIFYINFLIITCKTTLT